MKFNKYLLLQTTALRYKYQDSLNNLIANLVLAWLFGVPVAISRNRNTYSDTPRIFRPEHYSYLKIILSCLNQLVAAGYVNQTLGFYNNNALGNRSKLTRIELTDKLLNEIQLQEPEIKFNHKLTTPLILKDKNKKLITYPFPSTYPGKIYLQILEAPCEIPRHF